MSPPFDEFELLRRVAEDVHKASSIFEGIQRLDNVIDRVLSGHGDREQSAFDGELDVSPPVDQLMLPWRESGESFVQSAIHHDVLRSEDITEPVAKIFHWSHPFSKIC